MPIHILEAKLINLLSASRFMIMDEIIENLSKDIQNLNQEQVYEILNQLVKKGLLDHDIIDGDPLWRLKKSAPKTSTLNTVSK